MNSEEGPGIWRAWLNTVELMGFNPAAEPPITQAKEDAEFSGMGPWEALVTDFVKNREDYMPEGSCRILTTTQIVQLLSRHVPDSRQENIGKVVANLLVKLQLPRANGGRKIKFRGVTERYWWTGKPSLIALAATSELCQAELTRPSAWLNSEAKY